MIKDCNELRETLAEVEKSRLDIKSKLNSCQFNCATLNNQLKKRDLELEDFKRKLNSYGEEKKFWQQDLDSTGYVSRGGKNNLISAILINSTFIE